MGGKQSVVLQSPRTEPEEPRPLKVYTTGFEESGKTTIMNKFLELPQNTQYRPTIGLDMYKTLFKSFKLLCYEIGGSRLITFMKTYESVLRLSDCLIYVVDGLLSRDKIQNQKEILVKIIQSVSDIVPILIFVNKSDKQSSHSVEEIRYYLDLDNLLDGRTWTIMTCSGINGNNIEDGFNWLVEHVKLFVPEINRYNIKPKIICDE